MSDTRTGDELPARPASCTRCPRYYRPFPGDGGVCDVCRNSTKPGDDLAEQLPGGSGHELGPIARGCEAQLLDALDGVPLSDAERRSLRWLAGFEPSTVENIAGAIRRARALGPVVEGVDRAGEEVSRERDRRIGDVHVPPWMVDALTGAELQTLLDRHYDAQRRKEEDR